MTRAPRQHFAVRNSPCGLTVALCGHLTPNATQDREAVTCRLCIRELKASPIPPEVLAPTPWVPPPPKRAEMGQRFLTPHAQRCIEESRAGERKRYTFSSLDDALKQYAAVKVDGYASGSASAGHEALGVMGCRVQSDTRGSSKTTRQAEDIADVSRCIAYALSFWSETHPQSSLSMSDVENLFLLLQVGKPMKDRAKRKAGKRVYVPKGGLRAWTPMSIEDAAHETGLTEKMVRALRTWCRKRISVELMARDGLLKKQAAPVFDGDEDRHDRRMAAWLQEHGAVTSRREELGR